MFVGTGAVAVATRYCQQAFNAQGVKGQWAVAGTLLTALRKYLFSAPDPEDESRFDRPFPITVEANGMRHADGPQLLQMSTTLDRLVLNTRPFWGGKTAPIRTTVFPYPVPSVARWLLPVMYGGENRTPPARLGKLLLGRAGGHVEGDVRDRRRVLSSAHGGTVAARNGPAVQLRAGAKPFARPSCRGPPPRRRRTGR